MTENDLSSLVMTAFSCKRVDTQCECIVARFGQTATVDGIDGTWLLSSTVRVIHPVELV